MSSLCVYHTAVLDMPTKVLNHPEDIAATLVQAGLDFSQTAVSDDGLRPGCSEEMFWSSRNGRLEGLPVAGYAAREVLSLDRNHPQKHLQRSRFLAEQMLPAEQAWWFVGGYSRIAVRADGTLYMLFCERGDLLCIPAGMPYWMDIGEEPHILAVHLVNQASLPTAELTGEDWSSHLPGLDG